MSKLTVAADPISNVAAATGEVTKATADAYSKVRTAEIKAGADVAIEQLKLAREGIELAKKIVEHFTVREEWRGRIKAAELEVEKAWMLLEKARGDQALEANRQAQLWEMRRPLVELLNQIVEHTGRTDLPEAEKTRLRGEAVMIANGLKGLGR